MTTSPGVKLLDFSDVSWEVSKGKGSCLVEELLSIFQREEFVISILYEMLRTGKNCLGLYPYKATVIC